MLDCYNHAVVQFEQMEIQTASLREIQTNGEASHPNHLHSEDRDLSLHLERQRRIERCRREAESCRNQEVVTDADKFGKTLGEVDWMSEQVYYEEGGEV